MVRVPAHAYELSWFDERTVVEIEDGLIAPGDALEQALLEGEVVFADVRYRLRWLTGFEFAVANRALGTIF